MTIIHMLDGQRLVLALNGDLDLTTAKALTAALDELLGHYPLQQVVLDLGEVGFVDSSGLGVILGRYRRLHSAGRELSLVGVRPAVRTVLEVAGIPSIMPVVDARPQPPVTDSASG